MDKNKFDIQKNSLVLMVGVAGSGKSQMADNLAHMVMGDDYDESAVVSSDAIRKELYGKEEEQGDKNEVFALFDQRIEERLKAGKFTVADATNLDKQGRRNLYKLAKDNNRAIYAVVLDVDKDIAKMLNAMRKRKVPDSVIDKQFSDFKEAFYAVQEELLPDHTFIIGLSNERQEEIRANYKKMMEDKKER